MSDKTPADKSNKDPYDHSGILAFLFSMAFVFCFFGYISFIHPGVDLQENIKIPEVAVTQTLAEVDVSKVTEPWVANPDMVTHGKKVYAQNCAMCHGNEGKGDGPAGGALNPKPRNLVEGPWKKGGGNIGLMTVLNEGIAGGSMVAFKHLPLVDRWALVQFINSITKAKVDEDPAKVAEFAKKQQ
jgi:mono/diheme cytochrome c family protein